MYAISLHFPVFENGKCLHQAAITVRRSVGDVRLMRAVYGDGKSILLPMTGCTLNEHPPYRYHILHLCIWYAATSYCH